MQRWQANIILLISTCIWGATFIVQKISIAHFPPIQFTWLRFLIASVSMLPLVLWEFKKTNLSLKRDVFPHWKAYLSTGCALAVASLVQHYGIVNTSVANSSFLTILYVPISSFMGYLFFKDKLHWSIWVSSCGCVLGAYLLSGGNLTSLSYGDVLVIISAVFWALHIFCISWCIKKSQQIFLTAFIQFFIVFIVVGITDIVSWPLISSTEYIINWRSSFWILVFVGFFSTFLGYSIQVVAQKYTSPVDTSIILSSEAVFATLFGILILHESITFIEKIGFIFILISVMFTQIAPYIHWLHLKRT